MGASNRKFILLGFLFAVVLLVSSEVLAVKDLPEKALSEEKILGTSSGGGLDVELQVGGNEVEVELGKDGAEVEVEAGGQDVVEIEVGG
ncbi:hypothetical protein C5167_018808 [Papaver somniferum]|uniref:Uncharacterized protein n=1 Tax=Papaver somniferum TaxID=3469 RepID=A0A4Y7ISB2_PAPSO|nr:hypothetical protein C5167_018808 [Papaver somniferum]